MTHVWETKYSYKGMALFHVQPFLLRLRLNHLFLIDLSLASEVLSSVGLSILFSSSGALQLPLVLPPLPTLVTVGSVVNDEWMLSLCFSNSSTCIQVQIEQLVLAKIKHCRTSFFIYQEENYFYNNLKTENEKEQKKSKKEFAKENWLINNTKGIIN